VIILKIKLAERTKKVHLSPIREIFEMASRTPGLVRLEVGQPDFETPKHIIEEAKKALAEGHIGYTSAAGIQETREAISKRYKEDYDVDFNPNNEVVVTSGASGAIYATLRALINPGDEVLRPDPGYAQYDGITNDADGIPVLYPLKPDENFEIDFEKLESLITEKTKVLVVNSPSNPTGGVLDENQLEKLCDLADKHDIYIISDEAYDKVIYGKNHIPTVKVAKNKSRIITIGSSSKNYAMCGWRIGFAAGDKELMEQVMKFQSLTYICPNVIAQKAYAKALTSSQNSTEEMKDEYKRRRDYFAKELNNIKGFKCNMPDGAFYAFVDISEHTEDDWAFVKNLIENVKVTAIPGSSFGPTGKGFIRFSYASSIDNLEEAIKRMKKAFS